MKNTWFRRIPELDTEVRGIYGLGGFLTMSKELLVLTLGVVPKVGGFFNWRNGHWNFHCQVGSTVQRLNMVRIRLCMQFWAHWLAWAAAAGQQFDEFPVWFSVLGELGLGGEIGKTCLGLLFFSSAYWTVDQAKGNKRKERRRQS